MSKKNWDIENNFYYTSNKLRLQKIIDHHEIYKKILGLKGSVLEFGVFKGISLIRLLTFRDLLEKQPKRKIIAFDNFGKFPTPYSTNKKINNSDKKFAKKHDRVAGYGLTKKKLEMILKKKKFSNFELIKGDIRQTLPNKINYLKKKKIKISLLHLDVDVYEPTYLILSYLWKYIEKNGIILVDDYNSVDGSTLAFNDFLKKNKINIKIKRVSEYGRPYYFRKK